MINNSIFFTITDCSIINIQINNKLIHCAFAKIIENPSIGDFIITCCSESMLMMFRINVNDVQNQC